MATYAIGDIQGCYAELRLLLKKVQFKPAKDRLWLAGDLVNRGPDSLNVLRYVRDLGDAAQLVLGNHDLHFLAIAYGVRKTRRQDTLDKLLKAKDLKDLAQWLIKQPLALYDPERQFVMTHAGIPPIWDLNDLLRYAEEASQSLQAEDQSKRLKNLFGNQPDIWEDSLSGDDRLRVIINYLTRMRFCSANGHLELHTKGIASKPPAGYAPWFVHPSRLPEGMQVLFGHWAALGGKTDNKNIHALDTGCAWGEKLTALRLDDGRRFQVAAKKSK